MVIVWNWNSNVVILLVHSVIYSKMFSGVAAMLETTARSATKPLASTDTCKRPDNKQNWCGVCGGALAENWCQCFQASLRMLLLEMFVVNWGPVRRRLLMEKTCIWSSGEGRSPPILPWSYIHNTLLGYVDKSGVEFRIPIARSLAQTNDWYKSQDRWFTLCLAV